MDTEKSEPRLSVSSLSNMETVENLLGEHPTIWVFGYGSLLWKPDFRYKSKQIGYIEGYERRFYQGNVTFRGQPGQPGRVANLVEMKGSRAWGVAYEISGREEVAEVLKGLYTRETTCGGYVTMVTTFYPREDDNSQPRSPVKQTLAVPKFHVHDSSDSDLGSSISSEHDSGMRRVDSDMSDMSVDDSASDDDSTDSEDEREDHTGKSADNDTGASDLMFHFQDDSEDGKKIELPEIHIELVETSHRTEKSTGLDNPSRKESKELKLKKMSSKPPVQVLLYTATPDNDLYLGPDDVTNMARQIVNASGCAGSNVEYVIKIADYARTFIPEDQDTNLFNLDAKIREEVYRQYAKDPSRLHASLADLIHDLHDKDHEGFVEPVMAS